MESSEMPVPQVTSPQELDVAALSPGALALLDRGMDIYIGAEIDIEHAVGPRYVLARLDRAAVQKLLERARLCETMSLSAVEAEQPALADWSRGHEVDAGRWRVLSDPCWFWWRSHVDGQSGYATSHSVSFSDLLGALDAVARGDEPGSYFAYFGGALVYDAYDLGDLVSFLDDHVPELAARQVEMDMAAVIEASGAAEPADASTATSARRRPGI